MKAEKQGYITHEEWTRGLKALRADTIDELKKALPQLEKEVQSFMLFFLLLIFIVIFSAVSTNHANAFVYCLFKVRTPSNFADFYAYACRYSLTGKH